MLEHFLLWLSPATAAWPVDLPRTGEQLRRVLDAESRDVLGHIAIQTGRRWFWPAGRRIAAFEAPDSSVLFVAKRVGWFWQATLVADADGKVVAFVYGHTVSSPTRNFLAHRDDSVDWRSGAFLGPAGTTLVRWGPERGGTAIRFSDQVRNEPFVKMGLLAAIAMNG
ncbi:MAG TPA: hypothetical protein VH120_12150 [Gemmataceae bacterium]|jgi:hypothetical protein|nr:hypothetical protein [Gemmataceae bacterium]